MKPIVRFMRPTTIFFCFSLILILQVSAFAQELKVSEILKQSNADLIFVGRIDSYGRTYNETGSESVDGTFATYQVLRVLKGEYKKYYIEIRFPGHLGFGEKPSIVFVTSDMKMVVSGDERLGNCREKPCYYSTAEWTIRSSKTNKNAVKKVIGPK